MTDSNTENRFSTYYLENGSFLKLRNIQFGYTLPHEITRKARIERLRIYVAAQNVFTVKSKEYTGPDPENPGFAYPIPTIFTVGLNLTF